ncbi:MAG: hypothetical protein AAF357_05070 [Verrucomicrobiota bacterium]
MRKTLYTSLILVGFLSLFVSILSAEVEIGKVDWGRDLNVALDASQKSGKPVLILFQEVPG